MRALKSQKIWIISLFTLILSNSAYTQKIHWSANIVMPQTRAWTISPNSRSIPFVPTIKSIEITRVQCNIRILEQNAVTTLKVHLKNNSHQRQQAELLMPVPNKAVIQNFTYKGAGKDSKARILTKQEARRIYNGLVAKIKDPALLEFAGYNLIRSSVFPVDAHSAQWVEVTYEHLLECSGNRIDYVLPRSELLDYKVPWEINIKIKSEKTIAAIYSASHDLNIKRKSKNAVHVKIKKQSQTAPGAFRLSYLIQDNGVSASMFAYPDPKVGGGYFLLLAGVPDQADKTPNAKQIKREVTLVIDKSGSMNGEKIEQVREAALQIIAGLDYGEAFNIIVYENSVETFAKKAVLKNKKTEKAARKYIKGIKAGGGTNIHDAIVEALQIPPVKKMLPIVLFLTDGLPTVGQTSEQAIRKAAQKANTFNRRIFTFGVGVNVNAPLLEKIAQQSRGRSTFVLPKEDVEVKVSEVFKRLKGPVLADPKLSVVDKNNNEALARVHDILPNKLPDLFEDDQMVLLGKYTDKDQLGFVISGNYLGAKKSFKFTFNFNKATVKNAFVSRLWASRKIADLIDAVRQLGADTAVNRNDPRVKELVSEIVRLSTEFGILTEYTAFLAQEGVNIADHSAVQQRASLVLESRAMKTRSGLGGVNQSFNYKRQKSATLNYRNNFLDKKMNQVEIATVQQINDLTFYNKNNNKWLDSRLMNKKNIDKPDQIIEFGTDEFQNLLNELIKQNRQASIALKGDIIMKFNDKVILIKQPANL